MVVRRMLVRQLLVRKILVRGAVLAVLLVLVAGVQVWEASVGTRVAAAQSAMPAPYAATSCWSWTVDRPSTFLVTDWVRAVVWYSRGVAASASSTSSRTRSWWRAIAACAAAPAAVST